MGNRTEKEMKAYYEDADCMSLKEIAFALSDLDEANTKIAKMEAARDKDAEEAEVAAEKDETAIREMQRMLSEAEERAEEFEEVVKRVEKDYFQLLESFNRLHWRYKIIISGGTEQ